MYFLIDIWHTGYTNSPYTFRSSYEYWNHLGPKILLWANKPVRLPHARLHEKHQPLELYKRSARYLKLVVKLVVKKVRCGKGGAAPSFPRLSSVYTTMSPLENLYITDFWGRNEKCYLALRHVALISHSRFESNTRYSASICLCFSWKWWLFWLRCCDTTSKCAPYYHRRCKVNFTSFSNYQRLNCLGLVPSSQNNKTDMILIGRKKKGKEKEMIGNSEKCRKSPISVMFVSQVKPESIGFSTHFKRRFQSVTKK